MQSKVWNKEKKFTLETLKKLLKDKIMQVDFANAKKDVEPFLNDPQSVALWSNSFFLELVEQIVER